MRFGSIDLRPVSDGISWQDGGVLFGMVPRTVWERVVEPDDLHRIPLHLRSLIIETEGQTILIDTGLGDKLSETMRRNVGLSGEHRLVNSLEALDIKPEDVDLVINTHLHGDHCGGNTYYCEPGQLAPTFPRATYCVQRLELADAQYPNERTRATYFRENFWPLEESGQLQILWGDTRLSNEVKVIVTPGHTRSHQSVVIESGGMTALYLGDIAPWPIHMERLAWVGATHVEPLVTIETKRTLARWAVENHVLVFFDHHPEVVAGYLHPGERADLFRLEPVVVTP